LAFVGVDNSCVPEHSSPCWGCCCGHQIYLVWPSFLWTDGRWQHWCGSLLGGIVLLDVLNLELVDIRVFLVYFFKKVSTAKDDLGCLSNGGHGFF
jgi:hypothetical protein